MRSIFSLGDSAITMDLGDRIDEELTKKALTMRDWLVTRRIPGLRDIIVAYSSISLFYDPVQVNAGQENAEQEVRMQGAFGCMKSWMEQAWDRADVLSAVGERAVISVPVCYGGRYGPDLESVAKAKRLTSQEVIELHSSRIYRVYMIGFLPGFAYLGKVDDRLDMPRKAAPVPVPAGSVGIVGNQSGIYPLNSPGGWHIIGLTFLKLFDPQANPPIMFRTGDRVAFTPVPEREFEGLSRQAAGSAG